MARGVDNMDKEAMQQAARAFKQGGESLQDIQSAISKIASSLDQEIFVGDAGASFGSALSRDLMDSLRALEAHLNEISGDLLDALNKRMEAEGQAGKRFGN